MSLSKIYLVHLPTDVPGRSRDESPDLMLMQGADLSHHPGMAESDATAFEPVYLARSLRQLGAVRRLIPASKTAKTVLLDAMLAFCPASFVSCRSLRTIERKLRRQTMLDFRPTSQNVPEEWLTLQHEALARFAEFTILESRPALVKRRIVLPKLPRRKTAAVSRSK